MSYFKAEMHHSISAGKRGKEMEGEREDGSIGKGREERGRQRPPMIY